MEQRVAGVKCQVGTTVVAQSGTLQFRRLAVGTVAYDRSRIANPRYGRLAVCATGAVPSRV